MLSQAGGPCISGLPTGNFFPPLSIPGCCSEGSQSPWDLRTPLLVILPSSDHPRSNMTRPPATSHSAVQLDLPRTLLTQRHLCQKPLGASEVFSCPAPSNTGAAGCFPTSVPLLSLGCFTSTLKMSLMLSRLLLQRPLSPGSPCHVQWPAVHRFLVLLGLHQPSCLPPPAQSSESSGSLMPSYTHRIQEPSPISDREKQH